jgi:hypothetical protein
MKIDNVAAAEMPGFCTLFIESWSVEEVLPRIISPSFSRPCRATSSTQATPKSSTGSASPALSNISM